MITSVHIQNYRSFVDAEVKLRPFSLVVGANGSGKSNLLKFFSSLALAPAFDVKSLIEESERGEFPIFKPGKLWSKHVNYTKEASAFEVSLIDHEAPYMVCGSENSNNEFELTWRFGWPPETSIPIFNLIPDAIAQPELILGSPVVLGSGSGTAQVLESLKNGDREDLFDRIEESFKRYVPEIEKLSLRTVDEGKKQIQIREKGLKTLLPITELSEGTRLVLCILTILHQENPPPIILLEDIDRGLHPRLFEYVAPMMKDIAERHQISILATTHNPYLVDCFQDDKEAVIIVEKKDGTSILSTLADRLEGLDYDKEDPEDMPLGNLWFSGLVGECRKRSRVPPKPEMQKHLYIICEGEKDEIFYETLAERVTGQSFQTDFELRVRQGSNWKSVMSEARMLLNRLSHWQAKQDVAMIIAVDNDRAPGHPGGQNYLRPLPKADMAKQPRYSALKQMLESELGADRSSWPIDVALAVPVEMIESWLLILLDPGREELPPFSEATGGFARAYYSKAPPPQLKDLRDQEARARSMGLDELFWHAAEQDLDQASQRSASLQRFLEDLRQWN